jgi:hypothetical protein
MDDGSLLVERMEPVMEDYGRFKDRHKYKFVVYYDIVDSTATKAARQGESTESREYQVFKMKQSINRTFTIVAASAAKHRCEVFCTRGSIDSDDDGKYIFVSGKMARNYADQCIQSLLLITESFPGIHFRIYALPCGFVRSDAYRYTNDQEVRGPRFWTNLSRVLGIGKKYEEIAGVDQSFLIVGDQEYWSTSSISIYRGCSGHLQMQSSRQNWPRR